MRAAPAITVDVTRFGFWRLLIVGLAALSAGVGAAWLMLRLSGDLVAAAHLPVFTALMAGWLAWRCTRRAGMVLQWDGKNWWLQQPLAVRGGEPQRCMLEVMVDTGAWLLLRLRSAEPRVGRGTTWLPVQREGLEDRWHLLRAAIYSPQTANAAENHPE